MFAAGIFERCPALFERFVQHAPDYLRKRYERTIRELPERVAKLTWQSIKGPGVCGATHPGAATVFSEAMRNPEPVFYNSDCLYVNPARKVFAVSDPPGITDAARRLFGRLDEYLQEVSPDNIEAIIRKLDRETSANDRATLSLVYIPDGRRDEALALVAGDTFLYHGNLSGKGLTPVTGSSAFIGRENASLTMTSIGLARGDFFIIASDGVLSIREAHATMSLEDILIEYVNRCLEDFAFDVVNACNQCVANGDPDTASARFIGDDNVSVLLVFPEELADVDGQASFILGGHIPASLKSSQPPAAGWPAPKNWSLY